MQTECIRCGKMRIETKVWKDKTDRGAVITRSISVCPDAECQAIVDRQFAEIRAKKSAVDEKRKEAALLKKTKAEPTPAAK